MKEIESSTPKMAEHAPNKFKRTVSGTRNVFRLNKDIKPSPRSIGVNFPFKKAKDQETSATKTQKPQTASDGADLVRFGNKWMRVTGKDGETVDYLARGFEYSCIGNFHAAAARGKAKFMYVALTQTLHQPPAMIRGVDVFIDRSVAERDFDVCLRVARLDYVSAFIVSEVWHIFTNGHADEIIFPLWRAIIELPPKLKMPTVSKSSFVVTLRAATLAGLEEIEVANRRMLSAPTPKILKQLKAPIRLVSV